MDIVELTHLQGLERAVARSRDGLVYIKLVSGFFAAGEKLRKAVLEYNHGNHEALDMYGPREPQPTFEESTIGISRSSAGVLVFDPKWDRILRVLNQYDGAVIMEITREEYLATLGASEQLKLLKCPHCNAPIDYSIGETLFTCKYCGYTFSVIEEGEYKEIAPGKHFMLVNNYNETEMQEVIRDWMRKGILKAGDLAEKSKITEMELKFVPIWMVNVSADTTYHGKKKIVEVETRTRPSPKPGEPPIKEKIEKVRWEDKSGHFSEVMDWKILATKGMSLPLGKVELSVARKIPFKIENVSPGAKLINGDVDEKLAKEEAESGIRNYHNERASREVDQLLSIDTNVQVGEAQLLTVPFWFIRYKYKNKLYPVIFDGSSGEIVEGKAPMGKYDILMIAGIIIAIIIIIILAIIFWPK